MTVGIQLEAVTKQYRTDGGSPMTALDRVSISVASGEAVALVGPSGSGKSTLLHIIGGMDTPDSGSVRVGNLDVSNLRGRRQTAYRQTVGLVFQRFYLLPALTVIDNVIAPVLPYKTRFDKHQRARELLGAVGLSSYEKSLPSRLSGGEQQRVAIARALINHPALLLADEPTGNLDSATGREVMNLLLSFQDQLAMTIVVATHDLAIANRCDSIIRIRDGRILAPDSAPASTPEAGPNAREASEL